MSNSLTIALTGDLVLDEPDPGHWLSGIAPALRNADIAIGHLEVPHTHCTAEMKGDIPAPGAPPENLDALAEAGFDMVSLAGNHISDCGPQGISDTIASLDRLNIKHTGAGSNLAAARAPAIIKSKGRRVALLSYNCVGPDSGWASEEQAGCAFLRIHTKDGTPIAPVADLSEMSDDVFEILEYDVANAKGNADFVIVALHKGIVHTPAKLAPYEVPLAHAAIDVGADMVIGHHAHIVRGIEFYRDKPIFHGLGNGCVVTRALSPGQDHPERREWAERRKTMFGFEPDPAYVLAPFHPEAVNAFIGQVTIAEDGKVVPEIIPVYVEAPGRPVIAHEEQHAAIRDYVMRITRDAGLQPISITADGLVERVF